MVTAASGALFRARTEGEKPMAKAAMLAVSDTGCGTIVLGGGCFQNHRLLPTLARALRALGLEVLVPRRLSPNDGAVSVGQAAIGAALLANTARMAAGVTTTITRNGG